MIKVTRTITYYYGDERAMREDMSCWSGPRDGIIVRFPPEKTILSETHIQHLTKKA